MSEVKVNKISPRTNCGTVTVGDSGDSVAVSAGVPVTVNGDLKSNALKATDGGSIISQSGTTITLGASGDTINLASGASQSGFGREGSVDWQTGSIKTSTFTAVSGEGYFVNTSGGAVTANLPAGSAGAIVAFADYTRTFQTNSLTVTPNGSEKIGGAAGSLEVSVEGQALTLVYVDGTEGWINVQNSEDTETGIPPFIQATGGTITEDGNFKIHTFTGPGTFAVTTIAPSPSGNPNVADYSVVAGGGAGGKSTAAGGGGGAGGLRFSATSYCSPSPLKAPAGLTLTASTSYPITVGGGASAPPSTDKGANGSTSTFSTITSAGGGGGGGAPETPSPARNGQPGGSGGGSTYGPGGTAPDTTVGSGNTPPVSPSQGNNGGKGNPQSASHGGGGGGGFTAAGGNGSDPAAGNGGAGLAISITGSPVAYGGGGGGGAQDGPTRDEGTGGTGGGGPGGKDASGGSPIPISSGTPGTVNTGGGGGGSGPGLPGAGGSGIVIIRYKFQ
jgi:hypothetical protein